jgi:CRP/FNR family transcriptional regulator, nitrogen fixation regulation protein
LIKIKETRRYRLAATQERCGRPVIPQTAQTKRYWSRRATEASYLQHAEDHMLLLGRKTSLERVAAFLIEMDRRLTATGVMALPMYRRDIADYLGLTLETVSRALSRLHELGILGFIGNTQRQIVLLDRQQLASLDLQN